jgi:hypothetical protein
MYLKGCKVCPGICCNAEPEAEHWASPRPRISGCPVERRITVIGRLVKRGGSTVYQSWEFIPLRRWRSQIVQQLYVIVVLFVRSRLCSNPTIGWVTFLSIQYSRALQLHIWVYQVAEGATDWTLTRRSVDRLAWLTILFSECSFRQMSR